MPELHSKLVPYSSQAVNFAETPTLGSIQPVPLSPEQMEKFRITQEQKQKNPSNSKRVKELNNSLKGAFIDPSINNFKLKDQEGNVVSNPIQSFDGPDADLLTPLFGGRFAPPDTNAAVGPNHVVITTNSLVQVFSKAGVALTPAVRISTLMAGVANAADDDGDPVVLYDSLSDRWLVSQFNTRFTGNQMHEHIAISKTGDPTGAYFAYDFLLAPGRFADYPHFGVWPDGYYMSSNDFTPPGVSPFLGAGFYSFERVKMLAGDPTAKVIGFVTPAATDGGLLPTNLQGFTPPPVGTPNVFGEWFDTPPTFRAFEFRPNYTNPIASTLTQLADIPIGAFDSRSPAGRSIIDQPAPGEGLDAINDRLMFPFNFRMLPGGVQSYVLNWTVNVSGVNPTNAATYQGGVRWLELRRNPGTGVFSVNQEATYAPGSGSGTGRNLWMASVAQDGEGNIGLMANATAPGPVPAALNPTVVYTGRLAGDPANTLPQGEVDALAAVTKGVQTATSNRWGDYSSLFVDPADECTFWGAFEYVDSPTATFDWNTRIISFKVNPTCVTAPRGAFSGTITNCATGLPIQDAIVETTNGFLRATIANGTYSVTAAPGTYNVKVSKPGSGFNTVTGTVTVTNGGNAIFNACLQPTAIIVSAGATLVSESCAPANGAIDPGENVTVSFCVQNTGGLDTTNLVGTLQSTGGVTGPSGPQSYGVVVSGGPPVCRNFTFTAAGACGSTITATIQLQDGATNLGTVTYTFTLGTLKVAFAQNFDGVTAPNLPAGWTATQGVNTAGAALWVTSSAGTPAPPADTAPNSIFSPDPNNVLDNRIDTPPIAITTASAVLTFRNNFNLEDTFDGGVVEISNPAVNGGAFQDIITAGGSFVAGTQGYTDVISVNFASPIAGRNAFSGNSGGFVTTSINLPATAAGQNIVLRFREASDNSVSAVGWRVDTISIADGFQCCTSSVTPCAENFDGVTAPALPSGWTATTAIDCANSNPWATVSTTSDTAPNSAFVNDPNCIADERLDSRTFPIISASAQLTFRRNNNLESGFDGMVLEISIGGGPFQDILAAGGTFGTGGYNGTISVNFGSPIAGRQAWTGNSGGFVTTSVNLPASANGQNVVLRWRRGSDSSVSGVGAFIDTIAITGSNCGGAPCTVTCPANITRSNDPNQCGAVVTYPAPTTTGTCGTVTCSPASGSFFPKGTTTVTCTPSTGAPCTFTVTVNDTQPPTITCPANVTVSNDPNQCGAVVNYPAPTVSDNCPGVGTPQCSPASGSFFPKGTTTVTCTVADSSGNTATCTFTVTVNDTQPPSITCPANITAVTDQGPCPASAACQVTTFPNPVATDNCPGVTVACVPPSGTCFATGVTTVTCTATDTSGNTATCSFTVTTFDVAMQDDSNAATILLWNSQTGQYRFCCNGTTFTGVGKVQKQGCVYTLTVSGTDRRVTGRVDKSVHSGSASLQVPSGTTICTITDRNTLVSTNITQCQ